MRRRKHELWHELAGNMHPRDALVYFIVLSRNRLIINDRRAEIISDLVGYRDSEEAIKYVLKYFIHSEVVREFHQRILVVDKALYDDIINKKWDKREVCPDFYF